MENVVKCKENDYPSLVDIWERSVRATHTFLSEEDIAEIKSALIPVYFREVKLYVICHDDNIAGFIGLCDNKIEMLFIDPQYMGRGFGTRLIDFAKSSGADSVDVNEQNPRALEFYKARGFRVIGRDEFDDAGRPFPILHLAY